MQSRHEEHWANHIYKKLVVQLTNAVVNVLAVVVEIIHAAIADTTMFRRRKYMGITNRTHVFKFLAFKSLATY